MLCTAPVLCTHALATDAELVMSAVVKFKPLQPALKYNNALNHCCFSIAHKTMHFIMKILRDCFIRIISDSS